MQINFKVTSLSVSPSVHGVLGQTYREDERTYKKLEHGTEYKKLRSNGMPYYVDGEDTDYQTSGEDRSASALFLLLEIPFWKLFRFTRKPKGIC